jgi:apolipoprotein D and lipocalin family protein
MHRLLALVLLALSACAGVPEGVTPVAGFRVDDYLGTWYEIARLDHSFERGLDNVTAEYSLREDGGLRVVNRGYSKEARQWKEAVGKAYFIRGKDEGFLKVSFFGPFYGSYVVFEIDDEYRHAFVTSYKKSYLWLLSRTPTVEPDVVERFKKKAADLGFDTGALIFVDQRPPG